MHTRNNKIIKEENVSPSFKAFLPVNIGEIKGNTIKGLVILSVQYIRRYANV